MNRFARLQTLIIHEPITEVLDAVVYSAAATVVVLCWQRCSGVVAPPPLSRCIELIDRPMACSVCPRLPVTQRATANSLALHACNISLHKRTCWTTSDCTLNCFFLHPYPQLSHLLVYPINLRLRVCPRWTAHHRPPHQAPHQQKAYLPVLSGISIWRGTTSRPHRRPAPPGMENDMRWPRSWSTLSTGTSTIVAQCLYTK